MLKTLTNSKNIHILQNISGPGVTESSLLKPYRELQCTPLYLSDENQWIQSMTHNQLPLSLSRHPTPQLISVLIELEVDQNMGIKNYSALKKTPLYNQETCEWSGAINPDPKFNKHATLVTDLLLDILIKQKLNMETAESFKSLKSQHSNFVKGYNWKDTTTGHAIGLGINELLGCLIEINFDHAKGKKLFSLAKNNGLLDPAEQVWNRFRSNEQRIHTHMQLYGLLVELEINYDEAKEKFCNLKKTLLYDDLLEQWNASISPGITVYNKRESVTQLLGILVGIKLNKAQSDITSAENIPSLPKVRSF